MKIIPVSFEHLGFFENLILKSYLWAFFDCERNHNNFVTPLSQVNSGTLEVILLQKAAESALFSENAKKSLLENSTFGLFLRITLRGNQNAMLGVMKVLEANAASQQTLFIVSGYPSIHC